MGRAEADITQWVQYFCEGAADSFENVRKRAQEAAGAGVQDSSPWLRKLDPRQRKALELFRHSDVITSRDIAKLFTAVPTRRPQCFNRVGRARLPARRRSCKEEQEIPAGERIKRITAITTRFVPLVEAVELLGTLSHQDSRPAVLGLSRLARYPCTTQRNTSSALLGSSIRAYRSPLAWLPGREKTTPSRGSSGMASFRQLDVIRIGMGFDLELQLRSGWGRCTWARPGS